MTETQKKPYQEIAKDGWRPPNGSRRSPWKELMLITAMAGTAIAAGDAAREVIPSKAGGKPVSAEQMKAIYEEIKTPYKYGVVLKGEGGRKVDSPSVFRHGDKWYMAYITFDGTGYETLLATSDNLLDWKPLGKILPFREKTWDALQRRDTSRCRTTNGAALTNSANTTANTGCPTSEATRPVTKPIP